MKFRDIEKFPHSTYEVDVTLSFLEKHIKVELENGLNLDPDFQREHVWTPEQQTLFVEFLLRGGTSGRRILLNCPTFPDTGNYSDYVIVDGKQRLEACRAFLRDEVVVFDGYRFSDFEDRIPIGLGLRFCVAKLATRKEVLRWYLAFNTGGTPHTAEELSRVRKLYEAE